jgi:lysophospholipase L1-like esterase
VLLIFACKDNSKSLTKISDNAVILAFGDSLTFGTGVPIEKAYPNVLAKLSRHEVINEGIPGEISAEGSQRLPDLLDEYHPELLILIHGGNDILKKIPEPETLHNLNDMITAAKSRNVQVVMLGVPKPGLFFMESAQVYETIAETHNLVMDLDILPEILGDKELNRISCIRMPKVMI